MKSRPHRVTFIRRCAKCCKIVEPGLYHRIPWARPHTYKRVLRWAQFCYPNEKWDSLEKLRKLVSAHKVVCRDHFAEDAYGDNGRLKKTAVPYDPSCVPVALDEDHCYAKDCEIDDFDLSVPKSELLKTKPKIYEEAKTKLVTRESAKKKKSLEPAIQVESDPEPEPEPLDFEVWEGDESANVSTMKLPFSVPTKYVTTTYSTFIRANRTWTQPRGHDTGILIYNRIRRCKVPLVLRSEVRAATWYACGPTVYDSPHVGHACCYVKLDVVQRVLADHFGVPLVTAMNVTDIDDKIIKRSQDTGETIKAIVDKYEAEFWQNLGQLGVRRPDFVVKVSENLPAIKDFIAELCHKKFAYKAKDDGSLYFDVVAYGKYGKFFDASSSSDASPSSSAAAAKKQSVDFALWKAHKPGEPYWDAEWGAGRPGWHVECSAMATKLFGDRIDFHSGGVDLAFPHHENEEAQSCAHHSVEQWVDYWVHAGHLHTTGDAEKMSKSLKNTVSIDDMLKQHGAEAFRMACLMSHYRNSMEYGRKSMSAASALWLKFKHFLTEAAEFVGEGRRITKAEEADLAEALKETRHLVDSALRDDFDTQVCVKSLASLVKETNAVIANAAAEPPPKKGDAVCALAVHSILEYVTRTLETFGFSVRGEDARRESDAQKNAITALVQFRSAVRAHALKEKNADLLKECDQARSALMTGSKIHIKDKPGHKATWMMEE